VTEPVGVVQDIVKEDGVGARPPGASRYPSIHPDGYGIGQSSPVGVVYGLDFISAPSERFQIGFDDFVIATIKMVEEQHLRFGHEII
jgi:hypothetical protein